MEKVNILSIENATHDVVQIKTEKPQNITYLPGQAADVAIKKSGWEEEVRAFTFTSLPTDDHLEFFIKTYPKHKGVTEQIGQLNPSDTLLIGDVFGDIKYENEGIFIAGGAGITPFIAILKNLQEQNEVANNKLIFANKRTDDIIEHAFFNDLLGDNFINVLSEEKSDVFEYGFVTKDILASTMEGQDPYIYLCGPRPMMDAVWEQLKELGIEDSKIIKEQF